MSGYLAYPQEVWSIVTPVATTDGALTLVSTPGAGKALVVQVLTITITTSAARTFTIGDSAVGNPVVLFAAPNSLPVGSYGIDAGPLGRRLSTNTSLEYTPSAAGVGLVISAFGYVRAMT